MPTLPEMYRGGSKQHRRCQSFSAGQDGDEDRSDRIDLDHFSRGIDADDLDGFGSIHGDSGFHADVSEVADGHAAGVPLDGGVVAPDDRPVRVAGGRAAGRGGILEDQLKMWDHQAPSPSGWA
jgi:hypothetical protein